MFTGVTGAVLDAVGQVRQRSVWAFDDDELLAGLAELYAASQALAAACVDLVGEIDRRDLGKKRGCSSTVGWLTSNLLIAKATATKMAGLATRLERLPATAAAFADGHVTTDQAE